MISFQMTIETVFGIIQIQLFPFAVDAFGAHAGDESRRNGELFTIIVEVGRIFGYVAILAFESAFLTFAANGFIDMRAGFVFVFAFGKRKAGNIPACLYLDPRALAAGIDDAFSTIVILALGFVVAAFTAFFTACTGRILFAYAIVAVLNILTLANSLVIVLTSRFGGRRTF